MLSFYEWLHTQCNRPDTAGLMASDAISDVDFPRNATESAAILDYLRSKNAPNAALRVFQYLWDLWQEEVRKVA